MPNRYLVIKESEEHSDTNGNFYPDIFSIPINNFKPQKAPQIYTLSERDIYRFDLLIFNYYKDSNYDDIILMLNNIEHISDVEPGTKILLYDVEDINSFYKEYYV